MSTSTSSAKIWLILLTAQVREQPARFFATVVALALGVALGSSVYLVNTAALNEFGLATKRLVGEADIVIRKFTGLEPNAQGKLVLNFVPVEGYASVAGIEIIPQ